MNTVTHALAPVLLASFAAKKSVGFVRKEIIMIGIAGALPDLLNPHLSLEARMHSWSHGLPFWLFLSLLLLVLSRLPQRHLSTRLAGIISLGDCVKVLLKNTKAEVRDLQHFISGGYPG